MISRFRHFRFFYLVVSFPGCRCLKESDGPLGPSTRQYAALQFFGRSRGCGCTLLHGALWLEIEDCIEGYAARRCDLGLSAASGRGPKSSWRQPSGPRQDRGRPAVHLPAADFLLDHGEIHDWPLAVA